MMEIMMNQGLVEDVANAIANVENALRGRVATTRLLDNAAHFFVATPMMMAVAALKVIEEYEESQKPKLVYVDPGTPNIMPTATYIARCPKCQGEVPVTIAKFPSIPVRETVGCDGSGCGASTASTCPSGVRKDSDMCKEHGGVL